MRMVVLRGLLMTALLGVSGAAMAYNVSAPQCGGAHWLDRFRPAGGCGSDADCDGALGSGLFCDTSTGYCERAYWINEDGYPGLTFSEVSTMFADAWAVWEQPCCSTWSVQYKGTTAATAETDSGQHVLSFSDPWPSYFGDKNSTIGVTPFSYTNDCVIRSGDIAFNAETFVFVDGEPQASNECDLQSIAVHEMGHFLGLDHSATGTASMYPTYSNTTQERTLHQDDIEGVCFLYEQACSCTEDSQCAPGYKCDTASSQCVEDICTTDGDCESPLICDTDSGACVDPPCSQDSDCATGQTCDTASGVCVYEGCSVCKPCTENIECGSNAICVDFDGGGGHCTVQCGGQGACPGDSVCFTIDFSGSTQSLCLNPGLGYTGVSCSSADDCEASEFCETNQGECYESFCPDTYTCSAQDGCPNLGDTCPGGCSIYNDLQCVTVGTSSYCSCTCNTDADCGSTGICSDFGGGTQGCIVPCQGITCGEGQTCDPALNSCVATNCVGVTCGADQVCDPAAGSCVSTAGCPGLGNDCEAEYLCTQFNVCLSDSAGDFCTCTCNEDADCGAGNSCVNLGQDYCLEGIYNPDFSTSSKLGDLLNDADSNGAITPGDRVRYTITLTNSGNEVGTIREVRDVIPAAAESYNIINGGGGATSTSTDTELIVTDLRIFPGDSATIVFTITIAADVEDNTSLNNSATFTAPEEGGSGGTLTAPTLTIRRDSDGDKSFDSDDCKPIDPQVFPGRAELCDGKDNDCNVNTLDGADDTWVGNACDGDDTDRCPEGTLACSKGEQICTDDTDDNLEICDGKDNDCNGATADGSDEDWLLAECDGADTDLCPEGVFSCQGGTRVCGDETLSNIDLCDGLDNDCNPDTEDGSAEDWFGDPCDGDGDTDACLEGTLACDGVGSSSFCTDTTDSTEEICGDGQDNDCRNGADGSDAGCTCTDNDTQSCYSGPEGTEGVGPCKSGTQTCTGGVWGECTGEVLPSADLCDGVDNDCDAITPDGSGEDWYGDACDGDDSDACAEGGLICDENQQQACGDTTDDTLEICDGGVDNDCDGDFDEGCDCSPGQTRSCYSGPTGTRGVGPCVAGEQTCADGAWGDCTGEVLPSADLCDGVDNDCNANTPDGLDEDWFGQDCDGEGDTDLCLEGQFECSDSNQVCTDVSNDNVEICDGDDDDCDGTPDNGCDCVEGESVACYTGPEGTQDVGLCAAGTRTCSGGTLGDCLGQTLPADEICDGFDNDCDPSTPDGADACAEDEVCDGSACVKNLCDGVTCEDGEVCEPTTGDCVMMSVEGDAGSDTGSDVGSDTSSDVCTAAGQPCDRSASQSGAFLCVDDGAGGGVCQRSCEVFNNCPGDDTGGTPDSSADAMVEGVEMATGGGSKDDCACRSVLDTSERDSAPLAPLAILGLGLGLVASRRRR